MTKPPPRKRMSTAQRDAFYKAACGEKEFPVCPYCHQWVRPSQNWDASHEGVPHTWGGNDIAVWHSRCNSKHGAEVVTPMYAKGNRQFKKARDIYRSRKPFRTKDLPMKRTLDGRVVDRVTGDPYGLRKDD